MAKGQGPERREGSAIGGTLESAPVVPGRRGRLSQRPDPTGSRPLAAGARGDGSGDGTPDDEAAGSGRRKTQKGEEGTGRRESEISSVSDGTHTVGPHLPTPDPPTGPKEGQRLDLLPDPRRPSGASLSTRTQPSYHSLSPESPSLQAKKHVAFETLPVGLWSLEDLNLTRRMARRV